MRGRACAAWSATTRARAATRCASNMGCRPSTRCTGTRICSGRLHTSSRRPPRRSRERTSTPSARTPTSATALAGWLGVPAGHGHPRTRRAGADLLDRIRLHRRRHAGRRPAADLRPVRSGLGSRRCERHARRPPTAWRSTFPRSPRRRAVSTRASIWICDPNNPTGTLIAPAAWSAFLAALPAAGHRGRRRGVHRLRRTGAPLRSHERDVLAERPVIIVRSFSKIFGLAGLRLGYAVADPEVARLLDIVQEPFNVNRVALAAGVASLSRSRLRRPPPRRGGSRARGARARSRRRRHPSAALAGELLAGRARPR